MSLILEALKKSEQQRRLGEMPTLGTPAPQSRRRRSLLPLLAGLIVLALGAGWWFVRTPPGPPVDEAQPVSAAPAPEAKAIPPTAPARVARPEPKPAPPAKAPPASAAAVLTPMPTKDRPGVANPPPNAALVGTPGTAKPPAPAPAAPAPAATPKAGAKTDATVGVKTPAPAPAKPAADTANAPAKPTPPAGAKPAPPATTANVPATQAAPAKPAAPPLPSVWELPYGTRKELPDLKLTMHVYSDVPAERFIVLEGERHVEGDDLGNGVVLHEISADGMVLDFKGQRFLYPRDGR
ncbi:general secretion pathway protein GspB [Dokdonella fugitiva]|jgi:general secretion pathway protein B|uniref:General secretion pathway protein B n=1 Tax=Dokdonella fugitiva TaxID=328517 RepID=A0A4R2IFL5_9GAMM|nr:general secretion pathway protein GspB [Dokdonella fugitiva]TCO43016.1 general secretion pathway protein B [Dokdonella fugitiva]